MRNAAFLFLYAAAAAAKLRQSCPTLCDPRNGSPPGSPVPGILQAKTLEWVAISFSNARKWKVKVKLLSRVRFLATPWTAAHQAPPSMGFSRQEYWCGVPLPSPFMLLFNILCLYASVLQPHCQFHEGRKHDIILPCFPEGLSWAKLIYLKYASLIGKMY